MDHEKGNLSINSENILPIIKKWLYSDTDIFVRELVSNGADAITKLKKLVDLGDAPHIDKNEAYSIRLTVDPEAKTISIWDNGIGMTAEEVKKYINEIAFSGASDFMNKYKDKMDQENEIIGHFGLGFYSAFMVADKVQIDSLSYLEGAEPCTWVCEGGIEFELGKGARTERGTTITLYIGEDGKDFLEEYKLRGVLNKYCSFIPVPIYFEKAEKPAEPASETNSTETEEVKTDETTTEEKAPEPINDTNPLWLKKPADCTDEEYKKFYHQVFMDFNEPLFWIHLNMDYPFRLKGILYFPKLKHELESIEGQVKLYSNQVYIADNIKEVIPEFLLLLKGVLDCPDIPLNVSRSFLQNDGYVTKMSGYISKKVADKLNSLFKKDRETYNTYWDDINPFIKYGCIRDRSFYDKVKETIILKDIYGEYLSLTEYMDKNKEKTGDTVFYVSNEQQQAQYIKLFKENNMDAAIFATNLDNPFISYLESYEQNIKFARIDSDISEALKETAENEDSNSINIEELQTLFKEKLENDKLNIKVEGLKSPQVSAIVLLSEQERRMQEMSKMFGNGMDIPGLADGKETLVLNKNNNLVQTLLKMKNDEGKTDDVKLICQHIYDLAMLSHKPLDVSAMNAFIERSNYLLEKIAQATE